MSEFEPGFRVLALAWLYTYVPDYNEIPLEKKNALYDSLMSLLKHVYADAKTEIERKRGQNG